MELGELTKPPEGEHDPDKCPFCPPEDPKKYTTYPGEDNDSTALTNIMVDPDKLCKEQDSARPKDGLDGNQKKSEPQPLPPDTKYATLWMDEEFGPFSSEAHHLISGKQALAASGHQFERWISAKKDVIEHDTGYSVNNADNGVHAPSIPEKYKDGTWGKLDPQIKKRAAKRIMSQVGIQFHKGAHNITDKSAENLEKNYHVRYDKYIIERLVEMDEAMVLWSRECAVCKGKKKTGQKPQPSVRMNIYIDRLSAHLRRKISGSPKNWNIFLSTLALQHHLKDCDHKCPCRDQLPTTTDTN